MATDYDAPRKNDDEPEADSIEELTARQKDQSSEAIEEDENEVAEGFELPGADLSREELSVHVVPQLEDEFTCSECFLVHHRSQLAYVDDATGLPVCTDCAGLCAPGRGAWGARPMAPHQARAGRMSFATES